MKRIPVANEIDVSLVQKPLSIIQHNAKLIQNKNVMVLQPVQINNQLHFIYSPPTSPLQQTQQYMLLQQPKPRHQQNPAQRQHLLRQIQPAPRQQHSILLPQAAPHQQASIQQQPASQQQSPPQQQLASQQQPSPRQQTASQQQPTSQQQPAPQQQQPALRHLPLEKQSVPQQQPAPHQPQQYNNDSQPLNLQSTTGDIESIQQRLKLLAEEERQLDSEMNRFNKIYQNLFNDSEKRKYQMEDFKCRLLLINKKKSLLSKRLWNYHQDKLQESKVFSSVTSPTLEAELTPPPTPAIDIDSCFDTDLNDLMAKPFIATVSKSNKSIQLGESIDLTLDETESSDAERNRIDQHIDNFIAKFQISAEPVNLPDIGIEVGTDVTLQSDEFNNIIRSELQRLDKKHVKNESDVYVDKTVSEATTIKNSTVDIEMNGESRKNVSSKDLALNNSAKQKKSTSNRDTVDKTVNESVNTVESNISKPSSSGPLSSSVTFDRNIKNPKKVVVKSKSIMKTQSIKSFHELMDAGMKRLKKKRKQLQNKSTQSVRRTPAAPIDKQKVIPAKNKKTQELSNIPDRCAKQSTTESKIDNPYRRTEQRTRESTLGLSDERPKQRTAESSLNKPDVRTKQGTTVSTLDILNQRAKQRTSESMLNISVRHPKQRTSKSISDEPDRHTKQQTSELDNQDRRTKQRKAEMWKSNSILFKLGEKRKPNSLEAKKSKETSFENKRIKLHNKDVTDEKNNDRNIDDKDLGIFSIFEEFYNNE